MKKGIDVSENNGVVDWQAVADAGVEFVMVRSSYGKSGVDGNFAANVAGAHEAGLKVGAYHYSYALTVEDARIEAAHCRQVIDNSGVGLELPIFFDMEDADHWKENHGFVFDLTLITDICHAFIDNIGLNCGVYASLDWLENYIDWRGLGCSVWNAQWGENDDIRGYMWQYTDSLEIDGKCFDANVLYE